MPRPPIRQPPIRRVGTLLSTSLAGGADIEVVKERLGHSSIVTTQKYLGTLDEIDETAIDALDRTAAGPQAPAVRGGRREPQDPAARPSKNSLRGRSRPRSRAVDRRLMPSAQGPLRAS